MPMLRVFRYLNCDTLIACLQNDGYRLASCRRPIEVL